MRDAFLCTQKVDYHLKHNSPPEFFTHDTGVRRGHLDEDLL